MRGIKGALLLRGGQAGEHTIRTAEPVRIVRRGTADYERIVRDSRSPLKEDTEIIFTTDDGEVRADAGDVRAYIDLLVGAGRASAMVDASRHPEELPRVVLAALGFSPPVADGAGEEAKSKL